jgi:hypothetical protein
MRLAMVLVAAGIVLGACTRAEPPVLMEVAPQATAGAVMTEQAAW